MQLLSAWRSIVGGMLIIVGIVVNLATAPAHGQDFTSFYFLAAERFVAGQTPYVLEGNVFQLELAQQGLAPPIRLSLFAYPPFCAALFAPFVPLGRLIAQYTYLVVTWLVFCIGLWRLLALWAQDWSRATRLLAIGAAMCASSVRWSSGQYQLTLMVVGLLCLAVEAELRGKTTTVVVALVVASVKLTLMLPLVVLLLFRRKLGTLVVVGAVIGLVNLACFWWTGFAESYAGWRLNLANYIVTNGINYPSLDTLIARTQGEPAVAVQPPGVLLPKGTDYHIYPEQTHWVLIASAFTKTFGAAKVWALLVTGPVAVGLTWLCWRIRDRWANEETLIRMFAVWSCFGMVAVTHLKYDLAALIPVCFLMLRLARQSHAREDWGLVLVTFVSAFSLSAGLVTKWVFGLAVPLRAFWLVPCYAYASTLAFGLATWGLVRHLASPSGYLPPAPAPVDGGTDSREGVLPQA